MKFADLHVHTLFSDGTSAPEEIVAEAKKQDLAAIAIVDHDTIEGIAATVEIGQGKDLEVLPGMELSAEYNGLEIHILGYFIDYKNKAFRERLEVLKKNRIERIYKITDKLKGMGIALNPETVFALAGEGTVGRLHVARAMVKEDIVGSIYEAFQKFIGDKCPAYVLGFRLSPPQAIKLIKDAEGIPVLAHPYCLGKNELIPKLAASGIMGLEVYYPEHTPAMVDFYLGLAKKYNLLVTGGSDYHGEAKPEVKIGSIKIPYALVEKIRQAREKIK